MNRKTSNLDQNLIEEPTTMRSEVGTQARLTKVRGFWFIIVVTAVLSGFFGAAGALLLSPSLQPAPAEP